jgi:hypothetical protein
MGSFGWQQQRYAHLRANEPASSSTMGSDVTEGNYRHIH